MNLIVDRMDRSMVIWINSYIVLFPLPTSTFDSQNLTEDGLAEPAVVGSWRFHTRARLATEYKVN